MTISTNNDSNEAQDSVGPPLSLADALEHVQKVSESDVKSETIDPPAMDTNEAIMDTTEDFTKDTNGEAIQDQPTNDNAKDVVNETEPVKDQSTDNDAKDTAIETEPANDKSTDSDAKDTVIETEPVKVTVIETEPVDMPEIGPGWTMISSCRMGKQGEPNITESFFLSPKQKHRLPTREAVQLFQNALELGDGDETAAFNTISLEGRSGRRKSAAKKEDETTTIPITTTSALAKAKAPKSKTPTKPRPSQQKIEDPDPPPKKPPTAYIVYTNKLRAKVMEENPTLSSNDISKKLGEIWRAVPAEEKAVLSAGYSKEYDVYRQKMKEWQIRNPGRDPSKKKKRPSSATADKKGSSTSPKKKAKVSEYKDNLEDGAEWWEVEGFRDYRKDPKTGKEEYLIKWRGCPESSNTWEPSENLNVLHDAVAWRIHTFEKKQRIEESMKRLGLDSKDFKEEVDTEVENTAAQSVQPEETQNTNMTVCKRSEPPPEASKTKMGNGPLREDNTWNWDDASQVKFRTVQRINVHDTNAREVVTESRINGVPVVLTGHVGWANFALRWLRKRGSGNAVTTTTATTQNANNSTEEVIVTNENGGNRNTDDSGVAKNQNDSSNLAGAEVGVVPMEISKEENISGESTSNGKSAPETQPQPEVGEGKDSDPNEICEHLNEAIQAVVDEITEDNSEEQKLLDLSDPSWYLDLQAMAEDIGDEEVPVVRKNYNESNPIAGNILASKFFEVGGWDTAKLEKEEQEKMKKAMLYLHQWQFPLSITAYKKLCHQSTPLPNHILGEDLLKYWLDRVKLDSPLQYLFMGDADTMSKIHRDNGGLAISIAPITGVKECILVHRDDGHACLYHNQAPIDPEKIDLNGYPLLPHARIWKTSIKPGEILLMPHGTYHQCRNLSPCLSYSRFHLDGVNIRAFLHSMMDGDAPELQHDDVLWNSTRELIDIVDTATDEKRAVDPPLFKAVDALRALRNIAKEVSRKLHVRQTVKGMDPSSPTVSSTVKIDGDYKIWQSLVDDVDASLHDFRYRFNKKIPKFKLRRSTGKKVLGLPALPFRGKHKPSEKELKQGRNEPVIAFECPAERGYLALPEAPMDVSPAERKLINAAIHTVAVGDEMIVRIEGRQCLGKVTEVMPNARAAFVSFEDLPSLYNDFVPCDLLRTPAIGGSCLSEPPFEEIKPGKVFVCLMGKDEYRGVVQHIKIGRLFRTKLDFGNGFSIDKLIDSDAILSVGGNPKKEMEEEKQNAKRRKLVAMMKASQQQKAQTAPTETPAATAPTATAPTATAPTEKAPTETAPTETAPTETPSDLAAETGKVMDSPMKATTEAVPALSQR